jgi:hypothetical protein
MTAARVSRQHVEVLNKVAPAARVSRQHVEVLWSAEVRRYYGTQVVEHDTVQAGTRMFGYLGGQALETDTVQGLTLVVIAGGQALETETVQAGTARVAVAGGQALESDTTQAGTTSSVVVGTQVHESDSVQPGGINVISQVLLTVPAANLAADLTRFPVRLNFADVPTDWVPLLTGSNLRVRDMGGTLLPIDTLHFDPTDASGRMHFLADLSATVDNLFILELGTLYPQLEDDDPNGRNAVWADFDWAGQTDDFVDRTGHGHDATVEGTTSAEYGASVLVNGDGSWLQGVAYDPSIDRFFSIDTTTVRRYSADALTSLASCTPITLAGLTGVVDHLGDGSVKDGELFLLAEEYPNDPYDAQWVIVMDPATLTFKRKYNISANAHEASAICWNPDAALWVITDYTDAGLNVLHTYDVDFNYLGTLTLPIPMPGKQGIAWRDGYYYIMSGPGGVTSHLWKTADDMSSATLFWSGGAHEEGLEFANDDLYWTNHNSNLNKFDYVGGTPDEPGWLGLYGTGNLVVRNLPKRTVWSMGIRGKMAAGPGGNQGLMSYSNFSGTNANRATVLAHGTRWSMWNSSNGYKDGGPTYTSADIGVVHRFLYTHDSTVARNLYLDGAQIATASPVAQRPASGSDGTMALFLGANDEDHDERLNGSIGGIAYLRNGVLSAAWAAAEEDNWEAEGFYTVGGDPDPSDDVQLAAVVPATTAAFALELEPLLSMAATVPATTASFEVLPEALASMDAVVPATTASFTVTQVRELQLQATVPKTTASMSLSLARVVQLAAVVPATEATIELAPEALVQMAARVPATTASITLTFPPRGDISNRVGGRSRSGMGYAAWDPPVVPRPDAYAQGATVVVAQALSVPTINDEGVPSYDVQLAELPELQDRIVVGNTDVTYFRGKPTPFPGFTLVEPLMYSATTLTFPQIAAAFERVGVGPLSWLREGAEVLLQRVDPEDGLVYATDYRGVIVGFDTDGPDLTVQVGGELEGRAALLNRQVPIWTSFQDIGRYAYSAVKETGMRLIPYLGPTTGVRLQRFGGQGLLDYINELLARSWNRQGNQWTIMPAPLQPPGVYSMSRKDTETIHATAYNDDQRVRASLHRDLAEEPNRIYMTGVTPAGQRVRFGVYPGLRQSPPAPYPFTDGRTFGVGTTNAETDTGDGITVMIQRLIITKYLDQEDTPGGYDQQVRRAIMNLQDDAGNFDVPGVMDEGTWRALYDLDVTGYSLRWSHIEPAAQRSRVRRWNRSGSGAVMGRNSHYQASALKVDINIDVGSGFTRDQMREWAQAELETEDNWTGSITFPTGALVRGEHAPGDALGTSDVLRARDLRPGMNMVLPLFQGGTVGAFHIAAVTVDSGGVVSVDVDTRARDAMKVWEVIARNRESRNSPARAWRRDHRSSTMTKDSMGIWDEVGGLLGDPVHVPASTWVVFPVVAGQEGTVRSMRFRTTPAAEFVLAVFGDTIYATRLARLIGNPLTGEGTQRWADETIRDQLDRENLLLYVAGGRGPDADPLGYFPKTKFIEDDPDTEAEETGQNPLTGRWEDDASFSYHTGEHPVLWVAVYADRDTVIPAGRVMWNQLEAGV